MALQAYDMIGCTLPSLAEFVAEMTRKISVMEVTNYKNYLCKYFLGFFDEVLWYAGWQRAVLAVAKGSV